MSSTSRLPAIPQAIAWRGASGAPSRQVRLAAAVYFLAIGIAVFAEFVAPGRIGITGTLLPVACSVAVTLLLYRIFRSVAPRVARLAALLNLLGLLLEVVRWQPRGVNLAMVLHGIYAILLGWLMARSGLLPRLLGVSMALGGTIWLLYLAPPVVERLAPLNTALGLACEVIPMLWFLIMGVRSTHRAVEAQAGEAQT
jgi:uncharacterized protein DUF4386